MRVIEGMCERVGMMGGQLKTPPAGACNTNRRLTTNAVEERVMAASQSTHLSSCDAHRRNQLALSILNHRGADADSVREAIRALEGTNIIELRPAGDA